MSSLRSAPPPHSERTGHGTGRLDTHTHTGLNHPPRCSNTGRQPTSQQLFVCTHGPHAHLLVDDVHSSQTGLRAHSAIKSGKANRSPVTASSAVLLVTSNISHISWVLRVGTFRGAAEATVPVEAEAVQTLFARLVNRVESGAGILLLPAIWAATAPSAPPHCCLGTTEPLRFLPRGPGSVGSVSSVSSSFSDVTQAEMSDRQSLDCGGPKETRASTYLVSPDGPPA